LQQLAIAIYCTKHPKKSLREAGYLQIKVIATNCNYLLPLYYHKLSLVSTGYSAYLVPHNGLSGHLSQGVVCPAQL
jgi:hypothetical protein